MAFTSEQLEAGIVHYRFSGRLTMVDLEDAMGTIAQFHEADNNQKIVSILDLTQAQVTPRELDITRARRMTDLNRKITAGYVIVGAPQGVRIFSNIVKRVIKLNVVHVDDLSEALTQARELLESQLKTQEK